MHRPAAIVVAALCALPGVARVDPPPVHTSAPSSKPAPSSTQPAPCQETTEQRAYRLAYPGGVEATIGTAAKDWGLDGFVLLALLWAESRLEARPVHRRSGAAGISQLTAGGRRAVSRLRARRGAPTTFTHAMALEPGEAIPAAAELLAHLVERRGDLERAITAYNCWRCLRPTGFARHVLRQANRRRVEAGLPPIPAARRHPARVQPEA